MIADQGSLLIRSQGAQSILVVVCCDTLSLRLVLGAVQCVMMSKVYHRTTLCHLPTPGAGLDLALLHEGSSCGELSLVAGRPLW